VSKRLYLVRHCRAEGQATERPLTAEGRTQAAALADFLVGAGVDRIVSSPFLRARQSIEPLARRLGMEIETDPRLCERALGNTGPDWLDCLRATFDDFDLCFPAGESSRVAMVRAMAAAEDALRYPAAATILVTHGNLMTLLLQHFDPRFGFDNWRRLTHPDVFRLVVTDTSAVVERIWSP
jgi:2,3-bisphosphoglycerate-dependent phosphoglycerate mutase